jgi:transglutaminase-like putative cysteine protease
MRQAAWEDVFRQGAPGEVRVERPSPWSRLAIISWEELVTLLIVLIAFFTVVQSIDNADWVVEMPSLYGIGFLGLITGLVLAHTRIFGLLAHLIALAIGTVGVLYYSGSKLPGSVPDRTLDIVDRLRVWADAIVTGGISNDNIPFVVLVVGSTYLAAYLASLSIFRWYNAWIGLIPAGLALLTNISYLPGQKSVSLLIFLFCAILLIARVNLLRNARQWRRERTRYPEFISLSVLNVTVWVAIGLLALSWLLPVGSGSGAFYSLWVTITSPVAGPAQDLGRVFSAIDSKKGGTVHQFGATLPLQGEISLGGGEVMQVTASELGSGFLRAQSYDFYTAQGWKVGSGSQITTNSWPALRSLQSPAEVARQLRRHISLQVTTSRRSNVIVSAGQPMTVNVDTRVVFGPDPGDVTSVRPARGLGDGDQYRVDSTVSNASANALKNASTAYPPWTAGYLQLPSDLPARVKDKAREVAGSAASAFDKATAIEAYLRTFDVDTKIEAAPPKRDSVDYFLFEARRGYFDYHASAMVVMLRSLGIPARLAAGYVVHPSDKVPNTTVYEVDEANSFAWPEVFFPGLGWIEFNPTPSEPPLVRSGVDADFPGGFDPNEPFIDDPFANPNAGAPVQPAEPTLQDLQIDEGSSLVSRIITSVVLGLLLLTALAFGAFHYSWTHGLTGLPFAVQTWEKTLRLARWSNIRPLPQETPREVGDRLRQELPEVQDLDYLSESYIRSRYGGKELTPPEQERLESVWKQTRNNLFQRLLKWR